MIYGICGEIGSGKSTIADIMKQLNPDIEIISFAEPIRHILVNLFDVTYQDTITSKETKMVNVGTNYYTIRAMMRKIGAILRSIDPDIFIKLANNSIEVANRAAHDVVIPDVRYSNEYDYIRSLKGKIILVQRNVPIQSQDISERDWRVFQYDYKIENNGTIEELKTKIKEIL